MKTGILLLILLLVLCSFADNTAPKDGKGNAKKKQKIDDHYTYEDFERQFGHSYTGRER